MKKVHIWLPILVTVIALALLGRGLKPHVPDEPLDLRTMAQIPVVADGRVKPLDTFAYSSLMLLNDKSQYIDENGKKQPAIRWLMDVLARPDVADDHKIFRIENQQVLNMLGLEPRVDVPTAQRYRYAFNEFMNQENYRTVGEQAQRARQKSENNQRLDAYEQHVIELYGQLNTYFGIKFGQLPLIVPPQRRDGEWRSLMQAAQEAHQSTSSNDHRLTQVVQLILNLYASYHEQMQIASGDVKQIAGEDGQPRDVTAADRAAAAENAKQSAKLFNESVAAYQTWFSKNMGEKVVAKAANEVTWLNGFRPFVQCAALYLLAGVLIFASWLFGASASLRRAAFGLVILTVLIHTGALALRMLLQGRPPVTTLYSSAIFIGWGCVLLGVFLEWVYRNGLGMLVGAVTGFLSLIIAINLAGDGKDTMEMMRAVLDTNFWLATHVTVVTLGYTAVFIAGFIAIVYILGGVFTRALNKDTAKMLGRMIYGVICFATLLSFTGTVLGGIWADQSWGRFWGWDPKENGALMIVMWNVLILHARWGGMIRERGLAALAVFGNIVVAWSWFGVNMLGVGLHSYGFIDAAMLWLTAFVLSQLVIIGLGMLPLRMWRSFAEIGDRRPSFLPGAVTATLLTLAAGAAGMLIAYA